MTSVVRRWWLGWLAALVLGGAVHAAEPIKVVYHE